MANTKKIKMQTLKIKIKGKNKIKGFSLLEMIIAVAIFSLVVVAVMSAYVSIFKAGKNAKIVQKNIENVRGAMDIMAKTIRSGEADNASSGLTQNVYVFVYDFGSDNNGKCVKFSLDAVPGNIQQSQTAASGNRSMAPYTNCSTVNPASYVNPINLVNGSGFTVIGKFYVTPVSDTVASKVTILANVQSGTDSANLQTSVSLSGSKEIAPN